MAIFNSYASLPEGMCKGIAKGLLKHQQPLIKVHCKTTDN